MSVPLSRIYRSRSHLNFSSSIISYRNPIRSHLQGNLFCIGAIFYHRPERRASTLGHDTQIVPRVAVRLPGFCSCPGRGRCPRKPLPAERARGRGVFHSFVFVGISSRNVDFVSEVRPIIPTFVPAKDNGLREADP